ncbi:M23 family metallopeptidase [Pseudoxanthomonas sangjuensis]|uniref:peptidoglycan DD-metalloendopeptidase family protein n=1 Tax=Pseudoxanthomonas sangjuensis TaxID=1503750 RepID=UPI0013918416|nr:peptidoglycan DD-metalloendopeptidase family protein [Pseudoxanthomonas sangjuensis]KAF1713123.1 peptidase [Pseudoxanthomonas sangjuensis]
MNAARAIAVFAGTLLLALAASSDAGRLFRWKDRNGVTHYGDQLPPGQRAEGEIETIHFRNPSGAPVRLRVQRMQTSYQAWADNQLPGPMEVQLSFKRSENVLAAPALPKRVLVPARGSLLVATLYASDPSRGGDFELLMDAIPGDPQARPFDYAYRLPFDADRVRVDQGPGGSFSHADAQNRDAIDFAIPEGTPVLAARAGVVMQVESDFDKAGLNREKFGGRANFVRILHDDGSMAVYAHLQPDGAQVRVGQRVRQGDRIGLSGNTGFSTAPHLHFVVQVNRGMQLRSIPVRVVGPLGELKFPRPR